jgi:TfoX/Sxy family transcriptional regulator of competence genes
VAYNEHLASRVRAALKRQRGVTERRMFGGLAFLVKGHMACGVLDDTLVLRLGSTGAQRALERPHTRPMDFTGRPLAGMVYVSPAGHRRDRDLRAWLTRAVRFVRALPPR